MHFKLDENADPRWRQPLEQTGHVISTVAEELLQGAEDAVVAQTRRRSGFCLVTADLDFSQILEYPPEEYDGLIVLRHPHPTLSGMCRLFEHVASALSHDSPVGRL